MRRLQFGAGSLYCVGVWRWLFTLVFSLLWLPSVARAGELVVTFLDVGQGDAALITSPTGKRILIDGGPPTAENRLLSALQSRGVSSIDLLILSHPHLDHLGGLKKVVSALPVRMFLDGGFPSTSPSYVGLLKLLSGVRGAFTAVGDDDQAIYAWRGADVENLKLLQQDYPKLKVIKLEQNYRSSRRILEAANTVIANNAKLFDKRLWSEHGQGEQIVVTEIPFQVQKSKLIEKLGFEKIDKIAREMNCQARGSSGEHSKVIDRIDISNWRRLGFAEYQLA
mgnify:CR=1 FL=1